MCRRGGLVIGGLAGVFYGVQLLSSVARARRDYKDTIAAGLATGMVFGVACAQPILSRVPPVTPSFAAALHLSSTRPRSHV